jgi:O-succinylbenzoic acid--CoA ligase
VLTFANHFWSATASSYRLGLSPEERWLSCLPLYHVGGLAVVFRSCLYGTAIVLHERFDLGAFNTSLERDQITLTSLVPTMLHRLLAMRKGQAWPASLRHILLGGAAATPELLAAAQASSAPVATTYGLTEAASQVATLCPADVVRKPGSVGRPLMFTNVRIVDETGATLRPGEKGEIVVTGPTVMSGYYKNPAATAKTIRNGDLFTGDIGYLDDEGDLWLVQRRNDIIISGGENIYPAEVEAVLRQHPAVAAVAVVGVPNAEWGQVVAALVECHPHKQVTAAELLAFSRQQLAGYKQPRLLAFTDALPQTASGKIERRTVIERFSRQGG